MRKGDRVAIYMPMIPELPDRDARLRADRRAPHRRVRRVLGRGARRPHQRLRRQGADHRGRRLAARQARPAQAAGRRGRRRLADDRARPGRRAPRRRRLDHGARPRRVVARHRRPPVDRLPAGRRRQRAHAVPAVHVRHDGQAQGDPPHLGRLPARRGVHALGRVRHQARRRLLVRRGHRLGDRAQLHRLRPARQRDDRRPVRGRAGHARRGIAGGRSSRTTRSRSCTARRRPSARS